MRAFAHKIRATVAIATLLAGTFACGDDDDPAAPGAGIVGAWNVNSFAILGMDAIAQGMQMRITFAASGDYTIVITNDRIDACGGLSSCTQTGDYEATNATVTIDPGALDELALNYVIQGSSMTFTGTIDQFPVTIALTRVP